MSNLKIPRGPEELTAEWLTSALRETGAIGNAAVKSFDTKTLAEGVGFVGQLERVSLDYDLTEAGAPASLIAKFPGATEENREVGYAFRLYEREGRFYQETAREVELRTPRCYYSAMDVETGRYALLLEDLAPARVGDQ